MLDFSSDRNFTLSLAYQGVLAKYGSMENFNDFIEQNYTGEQYDDAIQVMCDIGKWLHDKEAAAVSQGVAG